MAQNIINIGLENYIPTDQIIAVLSVNARYIKALISKAERDDKLINLTRKKKTRSLVITKDGYYFLSIVTPRTLNLRMEKCGQESILIGDNNYIAKEEVLVVLDNNSSQQIDSIIKKARAKSQAFNTQGGAPVESYIKTKSGYIFLSHIKSKTISSRFNKKSKSDEFEGIEELEP